MGVFARKKNGNLWAMAGVTNGNGKFKDNNKSFDFTSRVTYSLPFNFVIGGIYRNGKQPLDERKIFGVDLTWKQGKIWINAGQNQFEYTENKTGQWLWGTYDVTSWFQLVGLIEKVDDLSGWSVGFSLSPTKNTVLRVSYFKQAEIETVKSWGLLFQQCF